MARLLDRCPRGFVRRKIQIVRRASAHAQERRGREAHNAVLRLCALPLAQLEAVPLRYAHKCGRIMGMSQTYCHSSKAFVRTLWETVLDRPLTVEILESAVSGAGECRFRITPLPPLP